MPSPVQLVVDLVGSSGRVRLPARTADIDYDCVRPGIDAGPPATERSVRQWLHPSAPARHALCEPAAGTWVTLGGTLEEPCTEELAARIGSAVASGRYERLAELRGTVTGSVVTGDRVCLFRTVSSADQIFYRRTGSLVEWSTDPAHLLHDSHEGLDREAIWRSCRGEGILVYPQLDFVRPGQVVSLGPSTTEKVTYDRVTPLELPARTTLREYAEITHELLLRATAPYAGGGRVGVLMSGGVDSSTVLMALVEQGADVTAYHMGTDDALADESRFAREACRHLSVPLVSVTTPLDPYFRSEWDFPHPFNHVWFQRISAIADRIREDGVTVLATGYDGDLLFGPLRYGLHDLLSGDVGWREKWHMLLGALSSRWELRRLVKSLSGSYSLFKDAEATEEVGPSVDFLVPMPDVPPETYDLDLLPHEHTLNLTVWRPRGIWTVSPLGSRDLRRLALRLPNAYRLIPYGGRMIDKPVLRLVASKGLPEVVWRHYGRTWLASPDERWCLAHPEVIADLIGSPESRLVAMDVVDPSRLRTVLADPVALRRNAESLICAGMTELFLRSRERAASRLAAV